MPRLKQYKETIREVLTEHPKTRDNDRLLYLFVCDRLGIDLGSITALKNLELTSDGILPTYDCCARERRAVQKENPDLAGKFDKDRHVDRVLEAQHQLDYNTRDQRAQEVLPLV